MPIFMDLDHPRFARAVTISVVLQNYRVLCIKLQRCATAGLTAPVRQSATKVIERERQRVLVYARQYLKIAGTA